MFRFTRSKMSQEQSPREFVRLAMNEASSPVVNDSTSCRCVRIRAVCKKNCMISLLLLCVRHLLEFNGYLDLQDIKLVVQSGDETIQILLKGHVIIVHNNCGPPQNGGGDAAGQGTAATIGQQAAAADAQMGQEADQSPAASGQRPAANKMQRMDSRSIDSKEFPTSAAEDASTLAPHSPSTSPLVPSLFVHFICPRTKSLSRLLGLGA